MHTQKNTEMTLAEYGRLSEDLMRKLTSNDLLYNGIWWANVLKRVLRKENPFDVKLWNTWKKIYYGGEDLDQNKLKKSCREKSIDSLNDFSRYVFKSLVTSEKKSSVDLLVAPIKMLGFEKPATISEINQRILELGFTLLTNEIVFNLFTQIKCENERLIVAMEPVILPDGQSFYFVVGKNLITYRAEYPLPFNYDVVFIKR